MSKETKVKPEEAEVIDKPTEETESSLYFFNFIYSCIDFIQSF